MVSYHRPKSGHITCYLNRTYHVLLTRVGFEVDTRGRRTYRSAQKSGLGAGAVSKARKIKLLNLA
jgi:hypothetical protein